LRRLDPHLFCDRRDDGTLRIDGCRKFGRPSRADQLARGQQARADGGIARSLRDIGGDPLADVPGHLVRTEQPNQAVIGQRGKTRFLRGRNVRAIRDVHAVADGKQLERACFQVGPHDRESAPVELDAPFGGIGRRLDGIAIGHLGHLELGVLQEGLEQKITESRRGCPIELARLRAEEADEIRQRSDFQARRRNDGDDRIGHPRDRDKIGLIVGQLVV
jgi:hypothetical protein